MLGPLVKSVVTKDEHIDVDSASNVGGFDFLGLFLFSQ